MTEEDEEDDVDQEPSVVDVTILQQKVRASKCILIFLCVGFLLAGFCAGEQMRKLFMVLTVASAYHLAFHIWCDCADPILLSSRHKFHVYLVMLTNVLLMTVAVPYKTIFARALAVLVMPLAFTLEDLVDTGIFGEGMQWLGSLAIVDMMVLDVSAMQLNVAELGRLLHVAYKSSEQVSRVTVKHLLRNLCESFVVIDAESKLIEDSATLAEMLGRSHHNKGLFFDDFVHYDDREEFRNHMAEWHGRDTDVGAKKDAITTTSLKIQLLDAYGFGMPSLLFFAKLWGMDGEFVYYVGICEAWQVKPTSKSKRSSKRRSHMLRNDNPEWKAGSLAQQLTSILPKEDQPDGWHIGLQGSLLDGTQSSPMSSRSVSPHAMAKRMQTHSSSSLPASITTSRFAYRKPAGPLPLDSM